MHGWWAGPYRGHPARWQGRDQVEDKSEANIRLCYVFLRSRAYTSIVDKARLFDLEEQAVRYAERQRLIDETEKKMVEGSDG